MTGMIRGFDDEKEVVGFSVLTGGEFLAEEVSKYLNDCAGQEFKNWHIETRFNFGGYGRSSLELENFMASQKEKNHLPLDHVYTAKMMFGVFDLISKGYFKHGSTVLALHTGGMQPIS